MHICDYDEDGDKETRPKFLTRSVQASRVKRNDKKENSQYKTLVIS